MAVLQFRIFLRILLSVSSFRQKGAKVLFDFRSSKKVLFCSKDWFLPDGGSLVGSSNISSTPKADDVFSRSRIGHISERGFQKLSKSMKKKRILAMQLLWLFSQQQC